MSGPLPSSLLGLVDDDLSAGFAHAATATVTRALWCAWTWAAVARAHLAAGDVRAAEPLIDRLDALPVSGQVARWAAREVPRLRAELIAAFDALRAGGRAPPGFVPQGVGGREPGPGYGGAA